MVIPLRLSSVIPGMKEGGPGRLMLFPAQSRVISSAAIKKGFADGATSVVSVKMNVGCGGGGEVYLVLQPG